MGLLCMFSSAILGLVLMILFALLGRWIGAITFNPDPNEFFEYGIEKARLVMCLVS